MLRAILFAGVFLLIAGGIGSFSGLKDILIPSKILVANRDGVLLWAEVFSPQAEFLSWQDIAEVKEGKISVPQEHLPVGKSLFPALEIVLRPESRLPDAKVTSGAAYIAWENKRIKIWATQLSMDLQELIAKLRSLKEKFGKA